MYQDIAHRLAELVREHYVLPYAAQRIADHVGAHDYPDTLSATEFAATVTQDLQAINGDLHLRVVHSDTPFTDEHTDPAAHRRDYAEQAARDNGGVAAAERLAGDIGYLRIDPQLYLPVVAGDAMGAALSGLADTAALILDVRTCGGGSPDMVAFVCSYLFDEEPVHLNDIAGRDPAQTRQFWTLPYVPGRRFGPDKPVYVLTGADTFSGAEELAYDLQVLGRATLVGATTRGGANPRAAFRLTEHLEARISTGRAVNPVTGTNWEHTGVRPDIAVSTSDARTVAHEHAMARG